MRETNFTWRYRTMTSARRKSIKKRLEQDWGAFCFYCHRPLTWVWGKDSFFTIDHYIPKAEGGTDEYNNLVPCCDRCNNLKGDTKPEEWRISYDKSRLHTNSYSLQPRYAG
jgi:5-methylcytosine-specific restriction endonuclease McrA